MKITRRVPVLLARLWLAVLSLCGALLAGLLLVQGGAQAQQPTVSVPTVTSTPMGTYIEVIPDMDQINVRGGPSTDYPLLGVLTRGQQVPALGRSEGGDWVMIVYPGVNGGVAWVYSPYVTVFGTLPIVEPPPTPTPATTPTINPTLAAQFIVEVPATRLPTFTPPPPLYIPTFLPVQTSTTTQVLPMGLVIVVGGLLGIFGLLISFFRGR